MEEGDIQSGEGCESGAPEAAKSAAGAGGSLRGGIVTAKGTGDGLVVRLDGRVEADTLKEALRDFVLSRQGFLAGNQVALEWISQEPEVDLVDELRQILRDEFEIDVKVSRLHETRPRSSMLAETASSGSGRLADSDEKPLGLFGGIEKLTDGDIPGGSGSSSDDYGFEGLSRGGDALGAASALWDDPDARVVYATLRSGQKIETEHSLIVVGDVNSGAELVAGGDIIVLGKLRGVAHAGAYDETGGGRFIFALSLQPTQLRIGMVISRGTSDGGKVPEIAHVDGNIILVESYQAKSVLSKMRRF